MLTKDDGMLAIVDMAISLVEFMVNFISALLSGDFSSIADIKLDTGSVTDLFGTLLS